MFYMIMGIAYIAFLVGLTAVNVESGGLMWWMPGSVFFLLLTPFICGYLAGAGHKRIKDRKDEN